MTIPAGTTIGSVVIEEKVSSGASGDVFVARQPGLERSVTVRRLRRDLLGSSSLVERFRREARLGARVLHPNVLQVFDLFADRGDYYLVTERVEGPTLQAILDGARKLPARIAVRIALEIARGLEEIQRRGIIHTDVRAEQVLISRWGEVKLAGLGCAREVTETDGPDPIEIGPCTAPEIQQGVEPHAEADVYSLAALLCEMLSGRSGSGTLRGAISARPRLGRILRRCLSERPSLRPRLPALRRALERSVGRGEADARIDIAAWMWEVQMLRPCSSESFVRAERETETAPPRPQERTAAPPLAPEPLAQPAQTPQPARKRPLVGSGRILPISLAAATLVVFALSFGFGEGGPEEEELPPVAAPPAASPAPVPAPPPVQELPAARAEPGRVSFVAVPWAEIRIDGQAPFLTPRAQPIELPPGEHEIVFRHPKFGEAQRSLLVRAGERRVVRHVFARIAP